ncbi:vWA domain-containing protein [Aporhodopirellula aestuarii]|uniref:VWA domain-containing protein n=1 Tax=Aporhodopirellula aestuarii TaxID=2950107 RepID=A0ABT0UC07_9BACT|nr:VWA domain-containing protein [Aporhodopirellula aestuarii]MCM2374445.1 VWA domain-containing protein [Aporhodopirellula aestuarii]
MIGSRHQAASWIGWATADAIIGGTAMFGFLAITMIATLVHNHNLARSSNTKLAQLEGSLKQASAELSRSREELTKAETDSRKWAQLLDESNHREQLARRRQAEHERVLRQELLGMQGSMSATVFVVDISESVGVPMAPGTERPNWGGDGTAWGFIRNQVQSYIEHLPVDQFRVIAFNHRYVEFPNRSSWAKRPAELPELADFLDSLTPTGTTGTELALRRAAEWRPTSIVLITDGAPSGSDGVFDPAQVDRILRWVESDEFTIPINVVAINNYFEPDFGRFLTQLAAASGGSFIGL